MVIERQLMRLRPLLISGLVALLCGAGPGVARADGFDPGANNAVKALVVQNDGKILVGGYFNVLGEEPHIAMGRLNVDGSVDESFNPEIGDHEVDAMVLQPDGKILVGGILKTMGGDPFRNIMRFNSDGSLDETFLGTADAKVWSLALQPDGKIVVGGFFETLSGEPRHHIGRLNRDGSIDLGFNPGATTSASCFFSAAVCSLGLQPDGKIVAGGQFNTLGGQPRQGIGRLKASGSLDLPFNPGASGSCFDSIDYLVLQSDGKILLSGDLGAGLVRLNPDGSVDESFHSAITSQPGSGHDALGLQRDGKILVGTSRLNPDGSFDAGFNPQGASDDVAAIALQTDGKIIVGGFFTTLRGQPRSHIARLNADGSLDGASAPCTGDCNGDRSVTVDEILRMVNIALGSADASGCNAGDANHDGQITIDEILTAVNNALNGCGGG